MKDLLDSIRERRSIYSIAKKSPISDERIRELVSLAVMHTPSAFNMQSQRAVLLLGNHHEKLWSITKDTLRGIVPPEQFESTENKIDGFAAGYGSILFFDDTETVADFQYKFPLYADNFSVWTEHSNGMLQYIAWTLLEAEGLGASLQHYNPLIDEKVKSAWDIPASWKLIAQMPFGLPTAPADKKEFVPIEKRFRAFE